MYLRLLLIVAVTATVFAATSFSRAKAPLAVVIPNNAPGAMHPNPMTPHEAHTFIEDLTGRKMCYVTTQEYKLCESSDIYEAVQNSHLGWRNDNGCSGVTEYKVRGWLVDSNAFPCAGDCYDPGACTETVPGGDAMRGLIVCSSPECQLNCYSSEQDFWDAVANDPCRFVY